MLSFLKMDMLKGNLANGLALSTLKPYILFC